MSNIFGGVHTEKEGNYGDLVEKFGKILNSKEERLSVRFRALFSLKNLGGKEAITQITKCFDDTSALLKHELAYCLGQMKSKDALEALQMVLDNHNQGKRQSLKKRLKFGGIGCIS